MPLLTTAVVGMVTGVFLLGLHPCCMHVQAHCAAHLRIHGCVHGVHDVTSVLCSSQAIGSWAFHVKHWQQLRIAAVVGAQLPLHSSPLLTIFSSELYCSFITVLNSVPASV